VEDNEIGYVLRVGCAFVADAAPGVRMRADQLVARFTRPESWRIRSVTGSKGERRYAWAWIATTSARHFLLVRKHLETGELAYHCCYIPPERPIQLMTLVRVACLCRPVEEGFEFGKDHLDSTIHKSGYTALSRAHRAHPGRPRRLLRDCRLGENPKHHNRSCHHTGRTATRRSRTDRTHCRRDQTPIQPGHPPHPACKPSARWHHHRPDSADKPDQPNKIKVRLPYQ
jgi:hypothetical protein